MEPQPTQRPQWEIDRQLTALIGAHIRVAARAFAPVRHTGQQPLRLAPVRDLILPDGSQAAVLAVYFEGRLRHFEREVGVVFVWLDAATSLETATDGPTLFRGQTAVILRGPAIVELAFPFQVERLPADPNNYWRDVRLPCVQFEFPFALQAGSGEGSSLPSSSPGGPQAAAAAPALVVDGDSPERRLQPIDSRESSTADRSSRDDTAKADRCQPQPGP